MQIDELVGCLDDPARAAARLKAWGLDDVRRGQANLAGLAGAGVPLDLLASLCRQLGDILPRLSDPDRALNNLERFIAAAISPLSLTAFFDRDREALPVLLQIFATSQYLSDLLVLDPQAFDLLRLTEGQPVARDTLVEELATELLALDDEGAATAELRRYKRRETLRIAFGDIIRSQRLSVVTEQISFLAEAIIEGAVRFARRRLEAKRGVPRHGDRRPAEFVVLALGKLGGTELNYSSDIDLIFLYDGDGRTDGLQPCSNGEFFDRLARDVVKLLTDATPLGIAYRVDLRLRPEGERGPIVQSVENAWRYYDHLGRTWERQAYVKARPVAGDRDLGSRFLARLEPWIYRRYLSLADITGVKALKRRIERRAEQEGHDGRDVKNGRGGIRDIEFVIQFLQLLNGGDLPALRQGNTLLALGALEQTGCLTHQERMLLEEHYVYLRRVEHRLQMMFDLQTHWLPTDSRELRSLALRLGYTASRDQTPLAAFESDYQTKSALNRKILDHLLHDAFADDASTEPEVDLVLDPDPPPERVATILAPYPFRDPQQAYRNLQALSVERVRFLSTRRCRHFLAAIAPQLLRAIAETPDPDATLTNLEKVSDSVGGKGVLWELFSFHPPSLRLCVELCSLSPYLTGLLVSQPGMIDELMDCLVLNKLPTLDHLRRTLAEVVRGAEDPDPILHSFKSTQILNVGVRDVLGKDDIRATIGVLSDVAQACLEQLAQLEYDRLVSRWGEPTIGEGDRAGETCRWGIVALGKLGGRELSYHSDLDVIFLYETDGPTLPPIRTRRSAETTTNQHFFGELAQRMIRAAGRLGPNGKLYNIDPRLRPTGRNGMLATSLVEFRRYFQDGPGQSWERQALCKTRVVGGTAGFEPDVLDACHEAAYGRPWDDSDTGALREMRARLEQAALPANVKRGAGGMVDIEFIVQALQRRLAGADPGLRCPNTFDALNALYRAGHLPPADFEYYLTSYHFLRSVEIRLRLMSNVARDDLPEEPLLLSKLARGLQLNSVEELVERCTFFRSENRRRFDDFFATTCVG